jgi:membrane-bound metal-dependent hydrolase YbcI (DUF457 family)
VQLTERVPVSVAEPLAFRQHCSDLPVATVISHALVAGSLASLVSADISKARLACVLGILAMLPDLDVIGFRLGIPYEHMLGHRGFTHSLLFAAFSLSAEIGRSWLCLRLLLRPRMV